MEVDKRGVKGGFLQLFDWNGKSRKKLFSSKSEAPESSNQGKENLHTSLVTRQQQGFPKTIPRNIRDHSDYYCASSSSGDSEYGTKAPGVVARLMGLDSLPTSNSKEPLLEQFTEFHSFRNPSYVMGPSHVLQNEHDIVIFESVRNKLDGLSRNPLDLRLQKLQTRPIERFQTEVLPPKSAKPISVTHHRLLSPIKSPGFIPPKNAAYIIEAASKIIEPSPRSNARGKLPSLGSSSTALKVRDLKEKIEAAHRSSLMPLSSDAYQRDKERNPVKRVKKQVITRGQGQLEDGHVYKYSEEAKRLGSQRLKNKEGPSSLSVSNKVDNVQKRENLSLGSQRSREKTKMRNEVKPGHVGKSLPMVQKKVENQSASRKQSQVLRLNHQKQNCNSALDAENCGPSCSQTKDRKDSNVNTNYLNGKNNRSINKIAVSNAIPAKKTNFVITEPGKEISSSRERTNFKKKAQINGNTDTDNSFSTDSMMKDEHFVKRDVGSKGESKWDGIDPKSSLDVVSFTFTSPIKKSVVKSKLNGTNLELNSPYVTNRDDLMHESHFNNCAESLSGSNVVGGDALTVLLEQKLKELTSMVEFSKKESSELGSHSGSVDINGSSGSVVVESLPIKHYMTSDNKHRLEAESLDKMEHNETAGDLLSQPSFSVVSCDSFDDRSSTEEGKSQPIENDVEISDTASSTSISYIIDSKDSSSFWELHYIRDILCSGELMLEDFALGQAHYIISPDLFERLENQKHESNKTTQERFTLERKVLFDCVSECLEIRCESLISGSSKFWAKQTRMFERKKWLSEEIYREISSWTNEEELNVDELVEKDMSLKNGKWIEFENEAFEEGLAVEKMILSGLVDELVDDFLV